MDSQSDQKRSGALGTEETRDLPQGMNASEIEELPTIEELAADCPPRMSRFQMERFVIQTEAPHSRYYTCCREIKARIYDLQEIDGELKRLEEMVSGDQSLLLREMGGAPLAESKDQRRLREVREKYQMLKDEVETFRELAARWKPLVDGHTYEELQAISWDETYTYRLCLSVLAGKPVYDVITDIMAMPENAMCRRLLAQVIAKEQGNVDDNTLQGEVFKAMVRFESNKPLLEMKERSGA